jgi:hypothetical protein
MVRSNKKSSRRIRRINKKRTVGGCGTCSSMIKGGNIQAYSVPNNAYPLNNHILDPINPDLQISSRLLPNMSSSMKGGRRSKSRRNKSRRNKSRHNKSMTGGGSISDFLLGNNTSSNQPLSFSASSASTLGVNILSGTPFVNSSTMIQPTTNMFSNANPPLV